MSRSPYFFVERPDAHTGKYELQHPLIWNFNHTKRVPADLYPYNGSHELFSIVEEGGEFPEMKGIHYGLPEDVSEDIKKELMLFWKLWMVGIGRMIIVRLGLFIG